MIDFVILRERVCLCEQTYRAVNSHIAHGRSNNSKIIITIVMMMMMMMMIIICRMYMVCAVCERVRACERACVCAHTSGSLTCTPMRLPSSSCRLLYGISRHEVTSASASHTPPAPAAVAASSATLTTSRRNSIVDLTSGNTHFM